MKFIQEFKEFALKGNILDMAVGVIIGIAFGAIVNSLVENVITPAIGIISGGVDLTELSYSVISVTGDKVSIDYGLFLQSIFDFTIIALSLFIIIKVAMNASNKAQQLTKKQEEEIEEKAPAKPDDVVLLEEIRDLLKASKK